MHVQRKVVLIGWFFLRANHPDYRNLEIDKDNLLALPEDGPITEQLPACEVDEPFFPNQMIFQKVKNLRTQIRTQIRTSLMMKFNCLKPLWCLIYSLIRQN